MKYLLKHTLIATSVAATMGLTTAAQAETEMVVVSWGGAYTASQQKAYHEPYMAANPDVTIINDDSAGEAVAKLRAMNEAGNVTWALVDMVASDAILLCEEGLLEEIDHDTALAAAPDGTPASADFGDMIVSPCYIPQIVYSTTF
ncbi:MAG: ABC transporter substrate-binding protein, partial [Gammaproteobacteria bacterium]|nr:ABC transporter substrate-binding protein [Gammaproteobacteria bacterium]